MQNNIQPCVMPNLVFVENNQAVTTTFALSQWANRPHQDVIRLVKRHIDKLNKFGKVHLKRDPVKTKTGIQTFEIATLNYNQAILIILSMRNNERTMNFKIDLINEFDRVRRQLANARKTYSEEAIKKLQVNNFDAGYATAKAIFEKQGKVTTRELVSENDNFAFGISKNSLVYEYLKFMRKIKANKEQWKKEVEEFNAVVGDACELSENCEKIKL